jgi:hypothetical protein
MEQTCWVVERVNLGGIDQFPLHGDVHLSWPMYIPWELYTAEETESGN